jgi:exodeoxyribonuclease VII large subunit
MTQLTFNLMPEKRVWTVSELTGKIRDLLARNFTDITVQGEISNCRPAQSGHIYFTLKDDRAQVRCVFFKQQQRGVKFRPEDGLQVTVRGSISVYEQRGEYQIYVEKIEPIGLGALQLAFEQLKKRLEAEGLFDPARKKPLPLLPSRIGIITSPRGAAVRDVVRILTRRFPNVHLTVYPVRVQGEEAAGEIVKALKLLRKKNGRRADPRARRRLAGRSVGFQRRRCRTRYRCIRNPRHLRHRPRNRFHYRGFCRRRARFHSFRRR